MASATLAYGPGILPNNPVGSDTIFIIQARNTLGKNRKSGTDKFIVRILKNEDAQELIAPKMKEEVLEEDK